MLTDNLYSDEEWQDAFDKCMYNQDKIFGLRFENWEAFKASFLRLNDIQSLLVCLAYEDVDCLIIKDLITANDQALQTNLPTQTTLQIVNEKPCVQNSYFALKALAVGIGILGVVLLSLVIAATVFSAGPLLAIGASLTAIAATAIYISLAATGAVMATPMISAGLYSIFKNSADVFAGSPNVPRIP